MHWSYRRCTSTLITWQQTGYSEKYLQLRKKKHLSGKVFGSPHASSTICLLQNYFSNLAYLKDTYIDNLERNWKNYV